MKDSHQLQEHFQKNIALESTSENDNAAERHMLLSEVKRLFKESAGFEKSKTEWRRGLMVAALVVAAISVILNIILGVAIAALTPLKTVEPYLLYVDEGMGYAELRQPLSEPLSTYGQAVDKYWIEDYTQARESYDWGLAQRNYDKVKAYSELGGSVFNEYDTFLKSDKSPLVILADKARIVVDINSTTIDEKTSTATVRLSKTVIGQDGKPSVTIPKTYWVATLRFEYPNPKLTPKERRLNPLGMKIPSYQLVQEDFKG